MVSIIIVNYNTRDLVIACIQSIKKNCDNFEIIVVDNNSTDDSVKYLSDIQDIILVKSEKNIGFARANNLGVSYAKGEFIIFLNPDTIVLSNITEQFKAIYLRKFNGKDVILAPKVNNPDGTTQHTLNLFPKITLLNCIKHYKKKISAKANKKYISVDWITGVCYFIHKKTIEYFGCWNEDFFLYSEDLELCYRYKKNGANVCQVSEISITHYGNQSGKQVYSDAKSYFVKMDALKKFFCLHYTRKKFIKYLTRLNFIKPNVLLEQYIKELKS